MEEKFDLYIRELPKTEPSFPEWKTNLQAIPDKTRLVLTLGVSKSEACAKMKEIDFLGGHARLLPVVYRTPQISLIEARSFALKYLQEINQLHKTNDELGSEVEAHSFWWRFRIGEEIIEGSLQNIDVTFLDGHRLTVSEWGEWMRLSSCE